MYDYYIGIDNGTSGSIGVVGGDVNFILTPTIKVLSHVGKAKYISRIDYKELFKFLSNYREKSFVLLERPFTGRFVNTAITAGRAFEATLICLEQLNMGFRVIDSKEWQKEFFPKGLKGSPKLKKASAQIGSQRFPQFTDVIQELGDADGLLIAEYCRMQYR